MWDRSPAHIRSPRARPACNQKVGWHTRARHRLRCCCPLAATPTPDRPHPHSCIGSCSPEERSAIQYGVRFRWRARRGVRMWIRRCSRLHSLRMLIAAEDGGDLFAVPPRLQRHDQDRIGAGPTPRSPNTPRPEVLGAQLLSRRNQRCWPHVKPWAFDGSAVARMQAAEGDACQGLPPPVPGLCYRHTRSVSRSLAALVTSRIGNVPGNGKCLKA